MTMKPEPKPKLMGDFAPPLPRGRAAYDAELERLTRLSEEFRLNGHPISPDSMPQPSDKGDGYTDCDDPIDTRDEEWDREIADLYDDEDDDGDASA